MYVPFEQLSDESKVWIYQADRQLTDSETEDIRKDLASFSEEWTAHNIALHAHGDVFYHRFIVLFADEWHQHASGCSVDRSVHFLEQLERNYQVSLFGRTQVVWKNDTKNRLENAELNELGNLYKEGILTPSTLVFDNLITTKKQFTTVWQKPLSESWHKRFVG